MPTYDYACAACGHRFEVIHGVHGPGPASCPSCGGGPVRKAIAAPSVHFKGSGWAKVDRRPSPKPSGKDSGTSTEPAADAAPKPTTDSGSAAADRGSAASDGGSAPAPAASD
jgi:putative FmdB family regulatory protein